MKGWKAERTAIVLMVIVGVAAGWVANRRFASHVEQSYGGDESSVASVVSTVKTDVELGTPVTDAELADLRERKERLETELSAVIGAGRDAEKVLPGYNAFFAAEEKTRDAKTSGDLRRLVPEAHAEWCKLMRMFMESAKRGRRSFAKLDGMIDASRLTDKEKAVHEKFSNALATYERVSGERKVWEDDYPLEALDVGENDLDSLEMLTELAKSEAEAMVGAAVFKRAREMGYSEEDADAIGETFRAIFSATNLCLQ